ncbi:Dual specificity phosphatase [Theobroma cacao]|nr:Dual specificity phosphatase [Theobroma cacao]
MRKRERENPCGVCGHYHKYEEGEVCGICGHRAPVSSDKTSLQVSAFPSLILPDFLYLGSYDNASRSELLKTQGITRVLNVYVLNIVNHKFRTKQTISFISSSLLDVMTAKMNIDGCQTVPACQNLYKNSFTYHCLQDDKILQFDDAIQFLEQCEKDKARVLVHCMSGKNRSPAIVIAYLMKSKRWRLPYSYQWVKERRSSVELTQAVYQQLQEYEQKLFGSSDSSNPHLPTFSLAGAPSLNFGFLKPNDPVSVPAFNNLGATSIFARPPLEIPPHEFTFGAGQTQKSISESLANPSGGDISMDST